MTDKRKICIVTGTRAEYGLLVPLLEKILILNVDAVVGNSSSGIYEVPSFQKPTVNIGDRQKGRLLASSVICCAPEKTEIQKAIEEALGKDCSETVNPYGQGNSADHIFMIWVEPDREGKGRYVIHNSNQRQG